MFSKQPQNGRLKPFDGRDILHTRGGSFVSWIKTSKKTQETKSTMPPNVRNAMNHSPEIASIPIRKHCQEKNRDGPVTVGL